MLLLLRFRSWHKIFVGIDIEDKELHEKWPELKKKLLKKYPHLTEDDLILEVGKEKELLFKLQDKLGENWKKIRYMLSLMG